MHDDVEYYHADRILDHRRRGRGRQFLIHYKGIPMHESTWRPESELRKRDPELLDAYLTKNELNALNTRQRPVRTSRAPHRQ